MHLTTANIRKRIQEFKSYSQDMEAAIEAIDEEDGWLIRILPIDNLYREKYSEEARILHTGSGINMKAKILKSKKAIYSLADRYGINHSNISFHSDYP